MEVLNVANEVSYIEYKGRAFVRENDTICYGNMTDPYILYMMGMSYKKFGNTEILYDALDVGIIWLERALA